MYQSECAEFGGCHTARMASHVYEFDTLMQWFITTWLALVDFMHTLSYIILNYILAWLALRFSGTKYGLDV